MALIGSMDSAFSAMDGFKRGFEVVGNNISNVNSIGYKSSKADFAPAFGNILRRSAPSNPNNAAGSNVVAMQVGNGMQLGSISTQFSQGALERTEKETDLAIVGNGFFKVSDSVNGSSFLTRAGNFRKDDRGYLVTTIQGYRVQGLNMDSTHMPAYQVDYDASTGQLTYTHVAANQPANAATVGDIRMSFAYGTGDIVLNQPAAVTGGQLILTVAAQTALNTSAITNAQISSNAPQLTNISTNDKGEVNYTFNDRNSTTVIGNKVMLTNVNDNQALVHEGEGLYSGLVAAGALDFVAGVSEAGLNSIGYLRSKVLEISNVDLTKQFSEMITLQRGFQAAARVITVSDEVLSEVVNLKR